MKILAILVLIILTSLIVIRGSEIYYGGVDIYFIDWVMAVSNGFGIGFLFYAILMYINK